MAALPESPRVVKAGKVHRETYTREPGSEPKTAVFALGGHRCACYSAGRMVCVCKAVRASGL